MLKKYLSLTRCLPLAVSSVPATSPPPTNNVQTSSSVSPNSSSTSASQPPALPAKPSSLNAVVNRTASNYSPYNANRFGASPYGVGGYSSYSSPYSRFGGMNSLYGGYGNGYGGMYGGIGGMGGMYGGLGQPGMMGTDPNDPNSLTNSFNQNTQATFQMIESLVGAFGGFAQMLESTPHAEYLAAMISVAEQFSNLRNTLGSILGIFTLLRWIRTLIAKVTGRPPPADATSLTPSAFASFQGLSASSSPNNSNGPPSLSKKPFIFFLLAVFGLPYLMTKLIRSLAASQSQQQNQQHQYSLDGTAVGPDGQPLSLQHQPIDPSKLTFCRVLYDYSPPLAPPGRSSAISDAIDLTVKKGDPVAVLSKSDPMGNASEWWRCRARDGRVGYLPGVYLEEIVMKRQIEPDEGRARTMSDRSDSSRANSLKVEEKGEKVLVDRPRPPPPPKVEAKVGDISVESFQKSGFYP
ncbi:MAG: hypothetical protein Q9167_003226 [Letrouitia subvulpina]